MTASPALSVFVSPEPGRAVSAIGLRKLVLFAMLFFGMASVCSVQRFGQGENEAAPVTSDSDAYIDMAHVFVGDAAAFNPALAKERPHHYGRPLLSWLAGHLSRSLLHDKLRAAFSVVDISGAALIALLMLVWMEQALPGARFNWLPSVLFLSAFPQMDWGYHILSDTLGFATAFASAFYAVWLIRKTEEEPSMKAAVWALHLAATAALASAAFLARETEWFAVITAGFVAIVWRAPSHTRAERWAIVLMLVLGEVPRVLYKQHFHLGGIPVWADAHMLLSPRYMLDWFVKTGVAFNFCWIAAVAGLVAMWRKRDWQVPAWVLGWSIAGVLYSAAGYRVNSLYVNGFPLRLSFGVFPIVFWLVRRAFVEWIEPKWQTLSVGLFLALQCGTNFFGVALDDAKGKITVFDILHHVMHAHRG